MQYGTWSAVLHWLRHFVALCYTRTLVAGLYRGSIVCREQIRLVSRIPYGRLASFCYFVDDPRVFARTTQKTSNQQHVGAYGKYLAWHYGTRRQNSRSHIQQAAIDVRMTPSTSSIFCLVREVA